MSPNTEAPKLQTHDDRLARIETLLVGITQRLDRIEQGISSLQADKSVANKAASR